MGKRKKSRNFQSNRNHFWGLKYDRSGDKIEIILKDGTERTIEKWKFNTNDNPTALKVFRILREKYSITFKPEKEKKDVDLDWLRKEKSPFE